MIRNTPTRIAGSIVRSTMNSKLVEGLSNGDLVEKLSSLRASTIANVALAIQTERNHEVDTVENLRKQVLSIAKVKVHGFQVCRACKWANGHPEDCFLYEVDEAFRTVLEELKTAE